MSAPLRSLATDRASTESSGQGPVLLLVTPGAEVPFVDLPALALARPAEQVRSIEGARARLARGGVDAVVLDASLLQQVGAATVEGLNAARPDVPVLVAYAPDEEGVAVEALRHGAQDCLPKGAIEVGVLMRAVRFAMERQRVLASLRGLSLVDELTGLYNRRGFRTLAAGHLQLARRGGRRCLLLFGDLDGLKQINDQHGHHAGDGAIVAAAQVLRSTFRQTDLLGRLGGDEFVVLAMDVTADIQEKLRERLASNIERFNRQSGLPFRVELTTGTIAFDLDGEESLDELLARADANLYAKKRAR